MQDDAAHIGTRRTADPGLGLWVAAVHETQGTCSEDPPEHQSSWLSEKREILMITDDVLSEETAVTD